MLSARPRDSLRYRRTQQQQQQRQQRRLIIGGHNVEEQRYPYYVSINKNNGVIVSGALIAPDIVLTAGHVVLDHMDNLTIKVGPYIPTSPNESFAETLEMEQYILHPEWNMTAAGLFRNDYLILKMANASSHEPIVLNRSPHVPADGTSVVIMGVGWTLPTTLSPSTIVQEVKLAYVSNSKCENASDPLRNGLSYAGEIDESMLCTMAPPNTTRDACAWDSGDPVIVKGENAGQDVLVGLGSSGVECADPVFPATQARISAGLEWIERMVCELSVSPPSEFRCSSSKNGDVNVSHSELPASPPPTPVAAPDDTSMLVAADLTSALFHSTPKQQQRMHEDSATVTIGSFLALAMAVLVLVGAIARHGIRRPQPPPRRVHKNRVRQKRTGTAQQRGVGDDALEQKYGSI